MSTPASQVIEKLTSFGSSTGELIQSHRLQKAGITQDGICRGICLDWTRRVLQGGNPSFAESKRPEAQTRRQARVYSGSVVRSQEYNAVNLALYNYTHKCYNPATDKREDVKTPEYVKAVLRKHLPAYAVKDTYPFAEATKVCILLERLQDSLQQNTSVGWKAFAQQLDREYFDTRTEDGRERGRRPFAGIRMSESKPSTNFLTAVGTITDNEKFPARSVIILGVDRKVGGSDEPHSVAVFRVDKVTFQFLDPNYGVFQYAIRGVVQALLYLFNGQTPIYGEDGAVLPGTLNYVVFRPES